MADPGLNSLLLNRQNIRLTDFELEAIQNTFKECFQNEDHLWIFGSRVNPTKKGGDIDLYVETPCTDADQVIQSKLRFLLELEYKIGERKVDVVIKFKDNHQLIHKIAKEEGIQLV